MYSSKLFNRATTLPLRPRSFNPSEAWIGLDCGPIPVAQPGVVFFPAQHICCLRLLEHWILLDK
jgi:hypothetical protein